MSKQEYYELYVKPMELPKGQTCGDCEHWKNTCEKLICSKTSKDITCDWSPSRFVQIQTTKQTNCTEGKK